MQQLTVHELDARLRAADSKPVLLLDVREPWEVARCMLAGSVHIPMRQIPARIEELDRDGEIVVICHHGIRSNQVAQFLDAQGFTHVYNLMGGVDAWAREVDPKMEKY